MQITKTNKAVGDKTLLIRQLNADLQAQGHQFQLPEDFSKVTITPPTEYSDAKEDTGNDTTVNPNTSVTVNYTPTEGSPTAIKFNYRRLDVKYISTAANLQNVDGKEYFFKANKHDTTGNNVVDYPAKISLAFSGKLDLGTKDLVTATVKTKDLVKGLTTYDFTAKDTAYTVTGKLADVVVETRDPAFGELTDGTNSQYFSFSGTSPTITITPTDLYVPFNSTAVPDDYFADKDNISDITVHLTDKITRIGNRAFKNSLVSLAKVTFPEGLTEIGEEAFSGAHTSEATLKDNITVGDDALGMVDTLTVLGEFNRFAEVVVKHVAGTTANYIYQKNHTAGSADENNDTYTTLTTKYGSIPVYLTKEELESSGVIKGTEAEGFIELVSGITLAKNVVSIDNTWFNGVNIATLDASHVSNFAANAFTRATITDLYLGDIDEHSLNATAFNGATITNIHCTQAVHDKLTNTVVFKAPNIESEPSWVITDHPTDEDGIPNEITSAGLNYSD